MKTIYVAHASQMDFQKELYEPIRTSSLFSQYQFIFPHDLTGEQFDSKNLFESKYCDAVLAEVSCASTGMGIELGWAYKLGIPIIAFCKNGIQYSKALDVILDKINIYDSSENLIQQLENNLRTL